MAQWVENNHINIHIFCTDIRFSPKLTALLHMFVYRCSQMLDGLVSSHPKWQQIIGEKCFITSGPGIDIFYVCGYYPLGSARY
jgi:hypothetical protein